MVGGPESNEPFLIVSKEENMKTSRKEKLTELESMIAGLKDQLSIDTLKARTKKEIEKNRV